MAKARFIAFYLPQFHPIPENDEWWGKGFTEWTNVAKAKPLFRGHYQPHIPADLGFYDLRYPEIKELQAEMAREAGIEGFCYWEYWFGNGKRLLEKPFDAVLQSGKPDYPFCLGWANESWSNKSWHNKDRSIKDRTLMEQTYSEEDYVKHFYHNLPAFKDHRYITVDGKPLYVIFNPLGIPDSKRFLEIWRDLAVKNGLKGIHFVATGVNVSDRNEQGKKQIRRTDETGRLYKKLLEDGYDALSSRGYPRAELMLEGRLGYAFRIALGKFLHYEIVRRYDYNKILDHIYTEEDKWENIYPMVMPNWDRSPRSGRRSCVYTNTTPEVFKKCVNKAIDLVKDKEDEHKIIFVKSWNEWGEGNHMEPDLKYGKGYLNVLKEIMYNNK